MSSQREREVSLWSCCNGETLRERSYTRTAIKPGMQRGRHMSPLAKMGAAPTFGERSAKRGESAHILYRLLTQYFLYRAGEGLKKT